MSVLSRVVTVLIALGAAGAAHGQPSETPKPTLNMLTQDAVAKFRRAEELPSLKGATWDCTHDGRPGYRCRAIEPEGPRDCGSWFYLKPYPADAHEHHSTCEGHAALIAWAKPSDVRGGRDLLTTYQTAAEQPFEQSAEVTIFMTNTVTVQTVPVRGLLQCRSSAVDSTRGAPHNCKLVAIESNNEWRIRALIGFDPQAQFGSFPDLDITLYVKGADIPVDSILKGIRSQLQQAPLSLTADPRRISAPVSTGGEMVLAMANPHWSDLLGEWLWPNVRIDRYGVPGVAPVRLPNGAAYRPHSQFVVTVSMFVSKYNTRHDWRMPKPDEITQYVEEIKVATARALEAHCSTSDWLDERRMICNAGPTTRRNQQ